MPRKYQKNSSDNVEKIQSNWQLLTSEIEHIVFSQFLFSCLTDDRRDRLRRILRKLLRGQNEVAVPVPVPVPVPSVPGEEEVHHLDSNSFEGSYVAISGRPGERTVHAVNGRTEFEIDNTNINLNHLKIFEF